MDIVNDCKYKKVTSNRVKQVVYYYVVLFSPNESGKNYIWPQRFSNFMINLDSVAEAAAGRSSTAGNPPTVQLEKEAFSGCDSPCFSFTTRSFLFSFGNPRETDGCNINHKEELVPVTRRPPPFTLSGSQSVCLIARGVAQFQHPFPHLVASYLCDVCTM